MVVFEEPGRDPTPNPVPQPWMLPPPIHLPSLVQYPTHVRHRQSESGWDLDGGAAAVFGGAGVRATGGEGDGWG